MTIIIVVTIHFLGAVLELLDTLVFIGGFYNLAFGILHLFLSRLFHWKEDIAKLTLENRGMFQIFAMLVTLYLFFLAYVSIFHTETLLTTPMGMTIIGFIALGWLVRTVGQIVIYGGREWMSWVLAAIFSVGFILYLIPLIVILR